MFFRFVSALVCVSGAVALAQEPSRTVYTNGTIYTADTDMSTADTLIVSGDRVEAVGTAENLLSGGDVPDNVVDLGGQTVVPGFIDSHVHLMSLGRSLLNLDVTGTESYDAIVDAVRKRAAETPEGTWILGRGWDQNDWSNTDMPHHAALSEAAPNHPVSLVRIGGHALLVNARALEIAGIDRDTPDPVGGKILRDAQGDATGVLIDYAADLVGEHVPETSLEDRRRALQLAIQACIEHGITSVHGAGVRAAQLDLYRSAIDAGEFDLRVYAMLSASEPDTLDAYFAEGPVIGYGEDRLTVRSVKAFADGAMGSRGAAMLEPYADDPENVGLMLSTEEQLDVLAAQCAAAGFQLATHAIGDRANRLVLDVYERAFATAPGDHRFRIEHAQVIAPEDIPRFAELDVIPSMQATHATSDMTWAEDRIGYERAQGAYAWRSLLDSGSRIASGSDFPVEGVNPLRGFYASVTRQDKDGFPGAGWFPEQRMTREEALRSFTIDAAYAAFEEDLKGSLEPGKLADFVVLDTDIMTIPASEILETSVTMTVLGGRMIYGGALTQLDSGEVQSAAAAALTNREEKRERKRLQRLEPQSDGLLNASVQGFLIVETLLIGLGLLAFFAHRLHADRRRLKFALHDKRLDMYWCVQEFLDRVSDRESVDADALRAFRKVVVESEFIFDAPVSEYIERIYRCAVDLKDSSNDDDKSLEWLRQQRDTAKDKFDSALRLNDTLLSRARRLRNRFDESLRAIDEDADPR